MSLEGLINQLLEFAIHVKRMASPRGGFKREDMTTCGVWGMTKGGW